jgi:hypothetical protein
LTSTKCDNLQFKLQNHEFETEVRVLDVQGYDLILGIDWLSSFGQMTVDLHKEKKKRNPGGYSERANLKLGKAFGLTAALILISIQAHSYE